MIRVFLITSVFLFISSVTFAAVEVNDWGQPVNQSRGRLAVDSGMELRSIKRVGIGANAAGAYGIMGASLELNLTPRWSSLIGFGFSGDFQSFNFQVRRFLGGEALLPYLGFGLAYWSNNGEKEGGIRETNPGFLANQFMSEDQRRRGEIAEALIYPAFGLQYMILQGEWTGLAIHLELDLLLEVSTLEAAPTGSMGMTYYF